MNDRCTDNSNPAKDRPLYTTMFWPIIIWNIPTQNNAQIIITELRGKKLKKKTKSNAGLENFTNHHSWTVPAVENQTNQFDSIPIFQASYLHLDRPKFLTHNTTLLFLELNVPNCAGKEGIWCWIWCGVTLHFISN